MSEEKDSRFHLDNFAEYTHITRFMEYNRISIVELTKDYVVVKHEMNENSVNFNQNAHGGLLMTMMDVCSGIIVRYNGSNCATSTMTANFFKPGRGTLYARGEYMKRGRRINVIHTWVYDESGTVLCDATTNMCQVD